MERVCTGGHNVPAASGTIEPSQRLWRLCQGNRYRRENWSSPHDIGTSPTILNEILKGKRNITADIALHLEAQLEIPADFWMKLQSQYDIDLARIKQRNIEKLHSIEIWKAIRAAVPVKYLEKLNILTNDLKNDIDRIKEIYNANSLEDIIDAKTAYTGLYRKSSKLQVDVNNLTCWAMVCRWMAQNKKAATYNASNLSAVKQLIIEIVNKNHNVIDEVTQLLYDYGIKFIILEKPDQTPVDGFSFFSGLNPVIAITLRKKTIDNFSFTVLHVIDNGVGIASDKLTSLFKLDNNTSTKGTANEKGTGLGLSLCKELTEKQGGKIWVESELGIGSRFIFTLTTKTPVA